MIFFPFLVVQCQEDCRLSRPVLPVMDNLRFDKFYKASWLRINQSNEPHDLKNRGLTGNVRYVLEKSYSIYYSDEVYFTAHIFNQRYTRDYFQFSFFDSTGFIREIWKYDHKLRLRSHEFYLRKNENTVRKLIFLDDSPQRHMQLIDESTPEDQENIIYRYEYDQQGNWIKRVEFQDSIASHASERTIGYFR